MAILDRWPYRSPLIEGGKVGAFWEFWFTNVQTLINGLLTTTQTGTGSPEGVVTAKQGTVFLRSDGGAGTTLYVKESGGVTTPTNTGWVGK